MRLGRRTVVVLASAVAAAALAAPVEVAAQADAADRQAELAAPAGLVGSAGLAASAGLAGSAGLAELASLAAAGSGELPGDAAEVLATKALTHGATPRPAGADPRLQLGTDADAERGAAWARWRQAQADLARTQTGPKAGRHAAKQASSSGTSYAEQESEPGTNDTVGTAEHVERTSDVTYITGEITTTAVDGPTYGPNPEDDGAIGSAWPVPAGDTDEVVTILGTVGDGPHGVDGTRNGDFDYVAVHLDAGQSLRAYLTTVQSDLDGMLAVYDPAGDLVAFNDDAGPGVLDPDVTFTATTAGTHYIATTGFPAFQDSPFDSASGNSPYEETFPYPEDLYGEPTGGYVLTLDQSLVDVDVFSVDLTAGDLLEVAAYGPNPTVLALADHAESLQHSTLPAWLLSAPEASPFDHNASITIPRVISDTGRYYVAVAGTPGNYTLATRIHRGGGTNPQRVFLDLDGHTLNPYATFAAGPDQPVDLSPLASFADGFGVAGQLDAVIDELVRRVAEPFDTLDGHGLVDVGTIEVTNSRDHADPGDDPDVTRLVIGGTIGQLGIDTIGLAQSLDVGNYDRGEIGVILLDALSAPPGEAGGASLNDWSVASESLRPEYVGHALGSVTAHEIGHLLGNFHTDLWFSETPSLMDPGGDFATVFGIGDDGVYGTADDRAAAFVIDLFALDEAFFGIEDTVVTTARALQGEPGSGSSGGSGGSGAGADPAAGPTDVFVLGGASAVSGDVAAEVFGYFSGATQRLAGSSRYDTAAAIVAAAFPDPVDTVYVATGANFPDALAGAAAAGRTGAPVLLTAPDRLPDATEQQLRRLAPSTVKVLGGRGAVSDATVEAIARTLPSAEVIRLAGTSRFGTAAAIVTDAFPDPVDTVYIATGESFPDALAGAAAAASQDAPVLLVGYDTIPQETVDELQRLQPSTVKVLGGSGAISGGVDVSIHQITGAEVVRLSGTSRYATAAAIVADGFPDRAPAVFVATGENFPDALAGAAAAAARRAPIILVSRDAIADEARRELARLA